MLEPKRRLSCSLYRIVRLCLTYTAILSLLSLNSACNSLQAQSDNAQSNPPEALTPSGWVVALGKLIPQGDVINISVANAEDSRVNTILVREGDFVRDNQIIATLQGRDRAEQQLREAQANVAVKRAQLKKILQGEAKKGEIAAQRAVIAEMEARLTTETRQKQAATQNPTCTEFTRSESKTNKIAIARCRTIRSPIPTLARRSSNPAARSPRSHDLDGQSSRLYSRTLQYGQHSQ
jgi:HlyD family secretion protein